MGFATNFLSASERERTARELLSCVQPATPGHRFTSACPFHSEKTPGGAFWYDPESDSAHCYSCGNHGDLIDIFCAVNGYDEGSSEGFREFLKRFAPDSLGKDSRQPIHRTTVPRRWIPRQTEASPDLWQKKAADFVSTCNKALFENADALASLNQWGITLDTATKVGLGWNVKRRFFSYSAWGLPYAENQNGREKHIYAPEGLVIPCYQRDEETIPLPLRLLPGRADGHAPPEVAAPQQVGRALPRGTHVLPAGPVAEHLHPLPRRHHGRGPLPGR